MPFDVFLSHDHSDFDLVDRIWRILDRIKISAYLYKRYPRPGEYVPETIKTEIRYCKYFVAFLTTAGVDSQWVNQEIGIAHAYDKLIIPINEAGVQSKGFVELREYIKYDPYSPEDMIYSLLYTLRFRLRKQAPIQSSVDCKCGNTLAVTLPSQEQVNKAIDEGLPFSWTCDQCRNIVALSPWTLEVM